MSNTETYPVLPLRNTTLFPENIIPIHVGRPKSLRVVETALDIKQNTGKGYIVFLSQKNEEEDDPSVSDLYRTGTVAEVKQVMKTKDGNLQVIVKGLKRVTLHQITQLDPYLEGEFEEHQVIEKNNTKEQMLFESLKEKTNQMIEEMPEVGERTRELLETFASDPKGYCDFIAGNMETEPEKRQVVLEASTLSERIELVLEVLEHQLQEKKVAEQIQKNVLDQTDKTQKEYVLRQQMKAIQKELGEEGDGVDELEDRVDNTPMPQKAEEAARKQIDRLRTMQSSSSEYSVTLKYIETLLDIPWMSMSDDELDLELAKATLDADHYGLDDPKERIVEYLAVRQLREDMRGPILCLVGPPGVGKSSLGKSIARTMGRKFVRVSLGGIHDESEIRGHRRTYIGSMPGRLTKALIKAGTANPVIMLDEIDKIGNDFRGDPEAAMLEVLDPEQNHDFRDHFVEVPLDLSKVLFIATANQLGSISAPLRDRMEIIEVPSYTNFEKKQIAKDHLIPKQIDEHGITSDTVDFDESSLDLVLDGYTREAGVRGLDRKIAELCRSVAVEVAKTPEDERDQIHQSIDAEFVSDKLGPRTHFSEVAQRVTIPGVATGLAWTQVGGDILFAETSKMEAGEGKIKSTGQLGDVMKESVEAAVTYIRANARKFGLEPDFLKETDLHVHFPKGAVPKDGPSAGITIFASILSVLTDIKIRKDIAMTGEITLRGNVLPVGGIKEKVTAAHRAGISTVILPEKCRKDLVDLNQEILDDMTFKFVERVDELPALVLEHNIMNTDTLGDDDLTDGDEGTQPVN